MITKTSKKCALCTCEINQLYKHDIITCICTKWCESTNELEPINMV